MRIKTLVAATIAALTLGWATKPDKAKHVETLAENVVEAVVNVDVKKMDRITEEVFPHAKQLACVIINGKVDVIDAGVLTIGRKSDGNGETISIGIYGHVFTFMGRVHTLLSESLERTIRESINGKY